MARSSQDHYNKGLSDWVSSYWRMRNSNVCFAKTLVGRLKKYTAQTENSGQFRSFHKNRGLVDKFLVFIKSTPRDIRTVMKMSSVEGNLQLITIDANRNPNLGQLKRINALISAKKFNGAIAEHEMLKSADWVFCLNPNFETLSVENLDENIIVFDWRVLIWFGVLNPFLILNSALKNGRQTYRKCWSVGFSNFLSTLLFLCLWDVFLSRSNPSTLIFTTSNSIGLETLRVKFILRGTHHKITEIFHGVPTVDFEFYLNELLINQSKFSRVKQQFVKSHPHINFTEPLESACYTDQFINLKLNKDLSLDNKDATVKAVDDLTLRLNAKTDDLVISLNGGQWHDIEYTQSIIFRTEQKILEDLKALCCSYKIPVKLIYSIHPSHFLNQNHKSITAKIGDVLIADGSFATWIISDLCISVISGSCWDAKLMGTNSILIANSSDNLFGKGVLNALSHADNDVSDVGIKVKNAFVRLVQHNVKNRVSQKREILGSLFANR